MQIKYPLPLYSKHIQMMTLYKAGILFLFSALVAGWCPDKDSIAPCTCRDIENGMSVQCHGPQDNADRIASVLQNLGDGTPISELVLESVVLPVSPTTAFSGITSLHLHNAHIKKTRSDDSTLFLWPKLSEVVVESSSTAHEIIPDFRNARLLSHMEMSRVDIPMIGLEFKEKIPPSLTYLDIRKTKTVALQPQAMSDLNRLQYFILVDVPLREFPRSALPSVMPNLHTFILGNTKLEKFEADFFEGMPHLEVLMLNGNKLTTLDYTLFAPIENQISHLLAERNPLICDCKLLWLSNTALKTGTMKVLATCNDHATEIRKDVITLDEVEYC